MKRKTIIAILLCMLIAFSFAACTEKEKAPPAPSLKEDASLHPPLAEDDMLLRLNDILTASQAPPNRIDITPAAQKDGWVETDDALLEKTSYLLCRSPYETVDMKSIEDVNGSITLQGGTPYCIIQLFLAQDGTTVLWLQIDEDTGQYKYDGDVFLQIEKAMEENRREDSLKLTGEYITLETQNKGMLAGVQGFAQNADSTLFATLAKNYSTNETAAFEVFDTANGKSIYYEELSADAEAMSPSDLPGFDCVIRYNGGILEYRALATPEEKQVYTLPQEMLSRLEAAKESLPFIYSFDISPAHGISVFAGGGEVVLAQNGTPARVILTSEQIDTSITGMENASGDPLFGGQFQNPKIMNGGKSIVLDVIYLASQNGFTGVAVYDIESGTLNWVKESFSPYSYYSAEAVNDETVALLGGRQYMKLNLSDMSTGVLELAEPEFGTWTADYVNFIYSYYEITPSGEGVVTLMQNAGGAPFFTARGTQMPSRIYGVTQSWVLMGAPSFYAPIWLVPLP